MVLSFCILCNINILFICGICPFLLLISLYLINDCHLGFQDGRQMEENIKIALTGAKVMGKIGIKWFGIGWDHMYVS